MRKAPSQRWRAGPARAFGWSNAAGIVFGMALAVASTVVLMRMLVDQDRLSTRAGHVAVGWLIVEDLFTVVALVILPTLAVDGADEASYGVPVATALGKAALFALLVWLAGSRLFSLIMERIFRTGSEELFTLGVFVVALGVAVIAATVFEVSVALGVLFRRTGRRPVTLRRACDPLHDTVSRRVHRAVLRVGRHAVQPFVRRRPSADGGGVAVMSDERLPADADDRERR